MADSSSNPQPGTEPGHLQGKLLLADPGLRDGVFDRSVVLLAHHKSDDGSYGLILNQPLGRKVGELLPSGEFEELRSLPVFKGGPVSPRNLTFAAIWWSKSGRLRYRIMLSAQDAIKRHQQPGTLVRAFVGYAGWTKGQLEEELERHAWMVTPAPSTFLGLAHDEDLWADTLRILSPFHKILAEFPQDPGLN